MGLFSHTPPQEAVAEENVTNKKSPIGFSRSASTDDHPSDELPASKEDPEVEETTTQSTSLKDYFVCLSHQMGMQDET
jgi:hypothetical protein